MNVGIGTEVALCLFWEYINLNLIFGTVYCRYFSVVLEQDFMKEENFFRSVLGQEYEHRAIIIST